MENLQKLKEIYLNDVDTELYEENLEQITEWEKKLIESENMLSWLAHDTTIEIKKKAKESFVSMAVTLSVNRELTEAQRLSIYAKQDGCLWILSLGESNSDEIIQGINRDINIALQNNV
jgi:hypothetical protein